MMCNALFWFEVIKIEKIIDFFKIINCDKILVDI